MKYAGLGGVAAGVFVVSGLWAGGCSGNDAALGGGATDSGSDVLSQAETSTSSDGGGGDAGKDSGGGSSISLSGRMFTAHVLYLGDTFVDGGAASPNAWKSIGTNVDGKTTTAGSNDVCTLHAGAPSSAQADGDNGIDNSFGRNIVPLFQALSADFSTQVNQSIDQGGATFMLNLQDLTDDPAQTLSPLPGGLFAGAHIGTPTWDTSDKWTIYSSSVVPGTSTAKANFPTAAIASGAWSSNGTGDVPLSFFGISITIHHASVSFAHPSAHRASGTLSGVIDTEEMVEAVRVGLAALEGATFCSGATSDSIAEQIREASDILNDGTNTSGVACNGISIGIGFDADETGLPTSAEDPVPIPNVCGD